jgi:hypothetical protein
LEGEPGAAPAVPVPLMGVASDEGYHDERSDMHERVNITNRVGSGRVNYGRKKELTGKLAFE